MSQPLALSSHGFTRIQRCLMSLRSYVRFDIRYRCRRLNELIDHLQLNVDQASVLDVGCGTGRLLASFPTSGPIVGTEICSAAVDAVRGAPEFRDRPAHFVHVGDGRLDGIPAGPFDIALSSHVLGHVSDDTAMVEAIRDRLRPGGLFFVFVGIDPQGEDGMAGQGSTLDSTTHLLKASGFRIVHSEGSMRPMNNLLKYMPKQFGSPVSVLQPIVDVFRLVTLSLLPYGVIRLLDRRMARSGSLPRQGFILALKPSSGQSVA